MQGKLALWLRSNRFRSAKKQRGMVTFPNEMYVMMMMTTTMMMIRAVDLLEKCSQFSGKTMQSEGIQGTTRGQLSQ